MGRVLALLICLWLPVLLAGCPLEQGSGDRDDVALAEAALNDRDIGDAEMYFERYLRKNPAGEKRWEVWRQLLSISLDVRQDKATTAEYLEIMLTEFKDDAPKRRRIQMGLASIFNDMRDYTRAVSLWETLAADPDTPAITLAAVYRELSHAYLRRLEFTPATEVLGLCLQLEVPRETQADCYYALAETQMLTGELVESEKALRQLLQLEEVAEERRVLAVFMLADVLEQQERLSEAAGLFESIRETYPNARVIEIRLGALKNKTGSKTTPAPKR